MNRAVRARRRLSAAEVEGFREGVAHRLVELRRRGTPDLLGEQALAQADAEIARGAHRSAEASLLQVHERLRRATEEIEVAERPRGLVSFVAPGPPDAPTPPDEDRLRNRILLLSRLASVRARSGGDVTGPLATLGAAARAIESGDRPAARRLVDRAANELEPRRVRDADRAEDAAAPGGR
ncbi:MAG TPA: hypothetical protein VGX00_03845 [Thermoplasmata archaeon]|nr:hypothetical protein [Thermoplasmata archaeon]